MLENYLIKTFNKENVDRVVYDSILLPLYLKQYDYKIFKLFGKKYVFVTPLNEVDIKEFNIQRNKIEKIFDCDSVYVLEDCNYALRNNLISHGIMFVEINKQIFIPSLGIIISDLKRKGKIEIPLKFTNNTQLVALFFIYENSKNIVVNDIKNKTKLNEMAISRALSILEANNLINYRMLGKKKIYNLNLNKKDYIDKIKSFCSSPVSRFIVVKKELLCNNFLTNYSALSKYTMLEEENIIYAISKNTFKAFDDKYETYTDGYIYDDSYVICEVWNYDPGIYAKDNIVDKFSLYLSLYKKNNIDERTSSSLNELMKGIDGELYD